MGFKVTAKTALVTGITGQDGAYLAQLLLNKGYRVIGAVRRASTLNLPRLAALDLVEQVELNTLDMQDFTSIVRLVEEVAPDEIYNLGGQSSVQASFKQPLYTGQTSGMGTMSLMEALRLMRRKCGFLRRRAAKFLVGLKMAWLMKRMISILVHPMAWPNYLPIGQWSIIARRMGCTPLTALCSTMKARCAGWIS